MGRWERLILKARELPAKGILTKHIKEVGRRFVFSDQESNPGSNIYFMIRAVKDLREPQTLVEEHAHMVESMMVFIGDEEDLSGLWVEVSLEGERYEVEAPVAIYLPSGLRHSYKFLRGSGKYINVVLAPNADYNSVTR